MTTIDGAQGESRGYTHLCICTLITVPGMVSLWPMEYLKSLNEAQKTAVHAIDGPVLVLAGAGAGKTSTIAHRIVHLVKTGVPAREILAITFTNKASREMRDRVLSLLTQYDAMETRGGMPTVSTFHALSAILLREFAEPAGIPRNFSIYDRSDSLRAIKRAIRELGEDEKRFEPRSVLSTISRAKGGAKTQAIYREEVGGEWYQGVVSNVWEKYDAILRKDGAVDFDDLLLVTWNLLTHNTQVRQSLSSRYSYIHIDEYQDTNKVQYDIVRLLSGTHNNIFCVGDLDQNVYSWRGSTVENILRFEEEFPQATVLKLEQNYRSTQTIVAVSNEVIKKNKRRKDKTLFTNNGAGDKLSLIVGYDERDEAGQVVSAVIECVDAGSTLDEIAILYRANFQSRVLEEAFLSAGISYRVLGTRFFDRAEVKDTLSYLRASLNPDATLDVRRVINTPARGIGKVTVDRLFSAGRGSLTGPGRERVEAFYRLLHGIREYAENHLVSEVLVYILNNSGIATSLGGKNEEDLERLENTRELVSLATTRYDAYGKDGALRLLEDASLATDQDELDQRSRTGSAVTLMTVHSAKGLEFGTVFIVGLEEGLFPHERVETSSSHVDTEEERRLFYVALTRAKHKLYLSYANMRTVFGQRTPRIPSEFILDINEDYFESQKSKGGKVIYLD
jgi:DNA helicase II / ATP-dependent DNA helicase PcrA